MAAYVNAKLSVVMVRVISLLLYIIMYLDYTVLKTIFAVFNALRPPII